MRGRERCREKEVLRTREERPRGGDLGVCPCPSKSGRSVECEPTRPWAVARSQQEVPVGVVWISFSNGVAAREKTLTRLGMTKVVGNFASISPLLSVGGLKR